MLIGDGMSNHICHGDSAILSNEFVADVLIIWNSQHSGPPICVRLLLKCMEEK